MGLIVAETLVAWRESLKASEPLLEEFTFHYDPAVHSLDMYPRSVIAIRISPGLLGSMAVVPWEVTETVQIVADKQTPETFGNTIHALVRGMRGRVYITNACRIWQSLLVGEPELAMVGTLREAVLTWHGTASWEA